jgi:hypothetical protein
LCTPGKTFWSVTHPEITLSQVHLTPEFFVGGLLKKKVYLGGMSILSILLSLEPGCHNDVLQKVHQDLEVQFNALWSSTSKTSSDPEAPKASTSKCYERCYNLDSNTLCDKNQPSKVE